METATLKHSCQQCPWLSLRINCISHSYDIPTLGIISPSCSSFYTLSLKCCPLSSTLLFYSLSKPPFNFALFFPHLHLFIASIFCPESLRLSFSTTPVLMRLRAKQVWGPVQVITFALLKLLALINSLCLVPFSCSLALHFSLFFFVLKSYCHTTSSFSQCCFNLIRLLCLLHIFLVSCVWLLSLFCSSTPSSPCLSVPIFEWQLWKWLLVLNTTSACVKGMTHLSASGALRYFWLFSFTFSCPSPFFHSFFFLNNLSRGKLFVIHKALFSPAEQTNLGQQAILTQLHFFYFSCANDLNIFPFS